ncbi:DNA-binding response OmpR family regulator [Rhizomicrobium palustre]|uniref:DNA-binding response OmpR family regulator n=1 Tax=Rhizomicrobium palustre TaxID=189966 RepID=A0A846N4D9_9PROT|nr:hypothetical protein [Rhizomicrobium palustre]NIK90503.1 DNA-binding response OmpR family regulator [Rhizomicrobium palustre]
MALPMLRGWLDARSLFVMQRQNVKAVCATRVAKKSNQIGPHPLDNFVHEFCREGKSADLCADEFRIAEALLRNRMKSVLANREKLKNEGQAATLGSA